MLSKANKEVKTTTGWFCSYVENRTPKHINLKKKTISKTMRTIVVTMGDGHRSLMVHAVCNYISVIL